MLGEVMPDKSKATLVELFEKMDANHDGVCTWEEFVDWMVHKCEPPILMLCRASVRADADLLVADRYPEDPIGLSKPLPAAAPVLPPEVTALARERNIDLEALHDAFEECPGMALDVDTFCEACAVACMGCIDRGRGLHAEDILGVRPGARGGDA